MSLEFFASFLGQAKNEEPSRLEAKSDLNNLVTLSVVVIVKDTGNEKYINRTVMKLYNRIIHKLNMNYGKVYYFLMSIENCFIYTTK